MPREPQSDQTYYKRKRLGLGPQEVKLGTRTIITETPAEYLARMAAESPQTAPLAPIPAATAATTAPKARRPPRKPTAPAKAQDEAAAKSAKQAARRFP